LRRAAPQAPADYDRAAAAAAVVAGQRALFRGGARLPVHIERVS
jgi:hypothetical protein